MYPRLHIESIGEGDRTFVMACGLSQTTANWRAFARARPGEHWVLFDPRGQGRSEMGTQPYVLEDHCDDLARVIDMHASGEVYLLGFSHGGRVALRYSVLHPERVRALCLVSTAFHASARRKTLLRSWLELLQLGGIEALAWGALPSIIGPGILKQFEQNPEMLVKGMQSRNSSEGLIAMLEGMASYPPALEDVGLINCPMVSMRGGRDPLLDDDDDRLFLQEAPDGRCIAFPQSGHTLALEEPDSFWDQLQKFVTQVELRHANFWEGPTP